MPIGAANSRLAGAILSQPSVKLRLLRAIIEQCGENKPRARVSREAFIEIVNRALVEDIAQYSMSTAEFSEAAGQVFDGKIDSGDGTASVRETISHYRFGFSAASGVPKPIGLPCERNGDTSWSKLAAPLRDAAHAYESSGLQSPGMLRSQSDDALLTHGRKRRSTVQEVAVEVVDGAALGSSSPPSPETILRLVQSRLRTQRARLRAKLDRLETDDHGTVAIDELLAVVASVGRAAHPPAFPGGAGDPFTGSAADAVRALAILVALRGGGAEEGGDEAKGGGGRGGGEDGDEDERKGGRESDEKHDEESNEKGEGGTETAAGNTPAPEWPDRVDARQFSAALWNDPHATAEADRSSGSQPDGGLAPSCRLV